MTILSISLFSAIAAFSINIPFLIPSTVFSKLWATSIILLIPTAFLCFIHSVIGSWESMYSGLLQISVSFIDTFLVLIGSFNIISSQEFHQILDLSLSLFLALVVLSLIAFDRFQAYYWIISKKYLLQDLAFALIIIFIAPLYCFIIVDSLIKILDIVFTLLSILYFITMVWVWFSIYTAPLWVIFLTFVLIVLSPLYIKVSQVMRGVQFIQTDNFDNRDYISIMINNLIGKYTIIFIPIGWVFFTHGNLNILSLAILVAIYFIGLAFLYSQFFFNCLFFSTF